MFQLCHREFAMQATFSSAKVQRRQKRGGVFVLRRQVTDYYASLFQLIYWNQRIGPKKPN